VLPKSNLGQAAAYVRRHWEALNRFAADARIPIDNNDCEQLMKVTVLQHHIGSAMGCASQPGASPSIALL
jgi:hypothetical protein